MDDQKKKKYLYLDCASGISGDMVVAALLDLGADRTMLDRALGSIRAKGFRTEIGRVKKSAIDCCDFRVILDAEHENHDHDMEYLYGIGKEEGKAGNSALSADGSVSDGIQEHSHAHHGAHHTHRTLHEIEEILADVDMTDHALELAGRIFEILAAAEAQAHGIPKEQVHFHEVGAIDSIVDIVAASVCMDSLHVDGVIVPRLCEGRGMVRTQHGMLPIPVPAVVNIVQSAGLNMEFTGAKGEYVTPTGAAFAAAVITSDCLPKRFRILATGLGAGKREQELPGILRAMLIQPVEKDNRSRENSVPGQEQGEIIKSTDQNQNSDSGNPISQLYRQDQMDKHKNQIWKLETNIDDCSGEALGYTLSRLMELGARDAHFTPVYMKKNRPGYLLTVICEEAAIPALENVIFQETTTIGVRKICMERDCLPRREGTVHTPYGDIKVKIVSIGKQQKVYPEYESVAKAAKGNGVSFETVYLSARVSGADAFTGEKTLDGKESFA